MRYRISKSKNSASSPSPPRHCGHSNRKKNIHTEGWLYVNYTAYIYIPTLTCTILLACFLYLPQLVPRSDSHAHAPAFCLEWFHIGILRCRVCVESHTKPPVHLRKTETESIFDMGTCWIRDLRTQQRPCGLKTLLIRPNQFHYSWEKPGRIIRGKKGSYRYRRATWLFDSRL